MGKTHIKLYTTSTALRTTLGLSANQTSSFCLLHTQDHRLHSGPAQNQSLEEQYRDKAEDFPKQLSRHKNAANQKN
jgi:hypothetical protein